MIINAVKDFCGEDSSVSERNITNVSLWIMGRKSGVELNEEEKEIVWYVQQNLADNVYVGNLNTSALPNSPMNLELKGVSIS